MRPTAQATGVFRTIRERAIGLIAAATLLSASGSALALPSFAQQTGYACSQCHTVSFGPALTAYGREFKLNGYVFGDAPSTMPLSLMIQGGYTHTDEAQPDVPAPHFGTND